MQEVARRQANAGTGQDVPPTFAPWAVRAPSLRSERSGYGLTSAVASRSQASAPAWAAEREAAPDGGLESIFLTHLDHGANRDVYAGRSAEEGRVVLKLHLSPMPEERDWEEGGGDFPEAEDSDAIAVDMDDYSRATARTGAGLPPRSCLPYQTRMASDFLNRPCEPQLFLNGFVWFDGSSFHVGDQSELEENCCSECGWRNDTDPTPLIFEFCLVCHEWPTYHHESCCPMLSDRAVEYFYTR